MTGTVAEDELIHERDENNENIDCIKKGGGTR
jgi:hypothetical protein